MVDEAFSRETWAPRALAALRIVTGYLFVQHGTAKLLGVPHVAMFDQLTLFSLIGLAGVLELVGGALIVLGLFTRPAAFILSGEMAVAYSWRMHRTAMSCCRLSTRARRPCCTASSFSSFPSRGLAHGASTR